MSAMPTGPLPAQWHAAVVVTPDPTPVSRVPDEEVTPGFLGFVVTFAVAGASILLIISMVRKVRGVTYRDRARTDAAESTGPTGPDEHTERTEPTGPPGPADRTEPT